jgi:multidrug efflux system membrane fusion protein
MAHSQFRGRVLGGVAALAFVAAGAVAFVVLPSRMAQSDKAAAPPPPPAVSVAVVERRDVALWDEFSGRLEAVERVEVRSRVAGAIQSVHYREGALVKAGDLLVVIDPAPYQAEVDRAAAQVLAAQARVSLAQGELERGKQLWNTRNVSQRDLDQRVNAYAEADGNLRAAQAALQTAKLNLGYTEIRAPVAGRAGKLEITVGNLVAAGPGAPVLTTLVSVDPIYASFSADEDVVARALKGLGAEAHIHVDRIPVRMETSTGNGAAVEGHLQLIDNQVDVKSGTVRVRAVFANADGSLMPGQFARLRMGQAKAEPAVVISERAIGTDQSKKFVLVVGAGDKAEYREVTPGAAVDGLRVVTNGLSSGERIVVNGLQKVRPGAVIAPQLVGMDGKPTKEARMSSPSQQAADVIR